MANIVDIIINATDNATRQIDSVNRALDRLGKNGGRLTAVLAGVSGSIAGLAPAVAGVGAMASMFASAGVGATAFGAVAVSAIGGVVDASEEVAKIEEKIKQADSAKERIKYQKELQQVMAGLSSAEKQALSDLQNFKSWWGDFTAQFQPQVFTLMGHGLDFVRNTMTALQPAIESTANVLNGFMEKVNASFKTEQVKSFFDYINQTAGSNLQAILTTAGNMFVGFMEILKAFSPLSQSFSQGMVNMSASFRKWAEGLSQSQGFQKFVQYVQANTPVLLSLIGNLFKFIGQLVVALAPLGSVVLNVASSFVQWATTSGLVQGALNLIRSAGQFLLQHLGALKAILASVVAGFVAFKAVTTVISIINTAKNVFNTLKTVITTVRTAFMLFNATLLANPITWIIAGIVALIAIGVLLYQNWDTVKAYAQQLWDKIKQVWEGIKTAISTAVTNIITAVSNWWNNMKTGFSNMMTSIGQAVSTGIQNVIQFFVSLPSRILGAIIYLTGFLVGAFIGLMIELGIAVKNGIVAIVNFFSQLPSRVMTFIINLASNLKSNFVSMMNNAKTAVSNGINNVVNFFRSLPSKVMSFIKNLASQLVSNFKSMMSNAKSAVSSGISNVVSFFSSLPSKVLGFIKSLASQLVSSFKSMMSNAKSAVSSGVQGVISAIKNFGSSFLSAGRGLIDAFTKGIKSAIGRAKSAVADGMSAIRRLLPFSPAKEGPLSDLDKSGMSFFPTWYEGALKKVPAMQKAIGGAMGTIGRTMERQGGVALEAFSGGRTQVRVVHEVRGTVEVQGDNGNREVIRTAGESVEEFTFLRDLRQVIRQR
jgi:phage-related protein